MSACLLSGLIHGICSALQEERIALYYTFVDYTLYTQSIWTRSNKHELHFYIYELYFYILRNGWRSLVPDK